MSENSDIIRGTIRIERLVNAASQQVFAAWADTASGGRRRKAIEGQHDATP